MTMITTPDRAHRDTGWKQPTLVWRVFASDIRSRPVRNGQISFQKTESGRGWIRVCRQRCWDENKTAFWLWEDEEFVLFVICVRFVFTPHVCGFACMLACVCALYSVISVISEQLLYSLTPPVLFSLSLNSISASICLVFSRSHGTASERPRL